MRNDECEEELKREYITRQHPHPTQALSLQGDVALTVGDFPGLDRLLVTHLTGQVADDVFGCLLNALFDGTGRDLGDGDVSRNLLVVLDKQQGAVGDLDLLAPARA